MAVLSNDGAPWSTKLDRIGERSARDEHCVFSNLGHVIDADMLKELYQRLDGSKAVGIDGVSKEAYGEQLDEWFESIKSTHLHGRAECIRYAGDMVYTFQHPQDAERFFRALSKRLSKYGLEMHSDKSRILPAGHGQACRARQQGRRLPTFAFLWFTCYWAKTRNGYWRLKYTSRKDRFAAKLKGLRQYLRKHLTTSDTHGLLIRVMRGIRGWVNYHGISDNRRRVGQFLERGKRIILLWFNRRGGNRRMTWSRQIVWLQHLGYPKQWKTVSMFQPC